MNYARASIALFALATLAVACGTDDDTESGSGPRTIPITMTDNKYEPTEVEVTKGETVTFEFQNEGVVKHEAVLGDAAAQELHHEEMIGGMDGGPDGEMGAGMDRTTEDDDKLVVPPGEEGELTYTFDEAGELIIGCHETGHWEAGMKVIVRVT